MSLLDDDGGDCSVFSAQDEEIFNRVSRGQGERGIAVLLGLRVLDVGPAMDRAVAHALNPAARLRRVVVVAHQMIFMRLIKSRPAKAIYDGAAAMESWRPENYAFTFDPDKVGAVRCALADTRGPSGYDRWLSRRLDVHRALSESDVRNARWLRTPHRSGKA
jgi:hypothetical protein